MKADRNDKRMLILQSAAREFSRKGYYKTTIEDIANGAEIGKSTVYEYFASKEQLFQSIIVEGCEYFLQFVGRQLEGVSGVENKLNTIVYAWLYFVDVHYEQYLVLNNFIYDHSLKHLNQYMNRHFVGAIIEPVQQIVAEGCASGELVVDDEEITAQMITGIILSMIRYLVEKKQPNGPQPGVNLQLPPEGAVRGKLEKNQTIQKLADNLTQSILYGIKGKK